MRKPMLSQLDRKGALVQHPRRSGSKIFPLYLLRLLGSQSAFNLTKMTQSNLRLIALVKTEEAVEAAIKLCKENSDAISSLQTLICAWKELASKPDVEMPQ